MGRALILIFLGLLFFPSSARAQSPRVEIPLTSGWRSAFDAADREKHAGFVAAGFDGAAWTEVSVPHNWDRYYGTRLVKNGNLHGYAWYRRTFDLPAGSAGRRIFLYFEGVGSYATVWVNGRQVGQHAGGLTTFTLDITDAVSLHGPNLLAVRADHPAGIRDLPWVGGGSERAYGFSEGSQPFGIFRPVTLVITDPLRIDPFGVHVWNDRTVTPQKASAQIRTEVTNHGEATRKFSLRQRVLDEAGGMLIENKRVYTLAAGATKTLASPALTLTPARLWSLDDPYLYTVVTELIAPDGAVIDRVETPYGFRWIDWPHGADIARGTFLLNGQPVFLNGTCEYPHLLGNSHAFGAEQIRARAKQIEAAGFNAFRDAHHPHDLRYQTFWDRDGIAWWTQFGAHIWFDNDAFRANFKTLLRDWVRERRNSPSLVLWGLQNESELPADFARECAEIIRALDPTCGEQRLVTTCNGGEGTDWDVPQNWSGTYGGDPALYGEELKKQILVGEYGAWRSLDLHATRDGKHPAGDSEDYMTALLETKVRLAETVRAQSAGHFQWIFSTHENPGRNFGARGEQFADGWAALDRIGPANNKGLLTLWGEPLDVYYMYRANYAPVATEPMVVIAGSTWPDRWSAPGLTEGIRVYSNCEEVELFNGPDSLGTRRRGPRGTHFRWDGVPLRYGELRAVGREGSRVVATDTLRLNHLPSPPVADNFSAPASDTTSPQPGRSYVYRVNCGGPAYIDRHGNTWEADRDFAAGDPWGAISWAQQFPHLPPALASARKINLPIQGTRDEALYQTFRYGREALRYRFALPRGSYRVELHFAEPWYGRGGGVDASGWRLFDVALNGQTRLHALDLWREAGFAHALVKTLEVEVQDDGLEISFPHVASYQAMINAIAISAGQDVSVPRTPSLMVLDRENHPEVSVQHWLASGDALFTHGRPTLVSLPESLRAQEWLRTNAQPTTMKFSVRKESDVYLATAGEFVSAAWEATGESLQVANATGTHALKLHRAHFQAGDRLTLDLPEYSVVVVVPTLPLAPPQVVRDLTINGAAARAPWLAAGHLRREDRLYRADGPALARLPSDLIDTDWLRTPATDTNPALSVQFKVTDHTEVYVGLDARITTLPTWLAEWRTAGEAAAGTTTFKLYKKRHAPAETVTLGANGTLPDGAPAAMYAVMVRPVRPALTYPAPPANTPDLATVGQSWTWPIEVGVGSRYEFAFAYTAPAGAARVRYEFLDRAGTVLCAEELNLAVSIPGKPNVARVRTCESFNAGSYQVRVIFLSGGSVQLGTLTVE